MEVHNIISAANASDLLHSENEFLARYPDYTVSFKRYFLSSREQLAELGETEGCVSYVIQPVLGEDNIAVWLFLTRDCPVELIWNTNMRSSRKDSAEQTREIFEAFESDLAASGLNIAENCVRTWIYVDDIDNNYKGVVVARRENFAQNGLTPESHFLASTGIFGAAVEPGCMVQMDALSIRGEFTQRYLYAPSNFNPTYEYGVTFERGVVLEYGSQKHTYISGTASINNRGEIVCPGDIKGQTMRMLENVEALLTEASSDWTQVRMMLVYLRNKEDYQTVREIFDERFQSRIPMVITCAPVCRPGWLIEMECIAG